MLKKIFITSVLTASVCAVMNANAASKGLYLSGQIGYADTGVKSRVKDGGYAFNNDGLAGRLAIGYKITSNAALELGYLQIPRAKFSVNPENVFTKQNALDIAAKGMLPITSNVNIYGKVGVAYLTTELGITSPSEAKDNLNSKQGISKRQWAPEVAVGMGYDITPNVTVDTSLTHIQTVGSNPPGNIDFLAVGVGYNFG